jgi:hypothetical protein
MRVSGLCGAAFGAAFMGACMGRAPQPVATVQPQDQYCAALCAPLRGPHVPSADNGGLPPKPRFAQVSFRAFVLVA